MTEALVQDSNNPTLQYLATKRSELSAPGVKLNDIYYSFLNSSVELAETTFNTGRLTIGLSQLNFGGYAQVLIPNNSLLSTIYLHLTLPAIVANQTLCKGWGYCYFHI